MTDPTEGISQRQAAILAALGVVLTLGGVAVGVACGAPPDLARGGDAAAVSATITAAGGLFRVGVLGWAVAILGDVVRAWALYVFFRGVNRSLAMLAAWWMLLHDAVFGFALACLLAASELAGGVGPFAALTPEQAQPLVMMLLHAHRYGFNLGLVFFSFHLLCNGLLVLASRTVPRGLGLLSIAAFLGYLVNGASELLVLDPPGIINAVVVVPNTIGELALVVWLAIWGGRQRGVGAPRAAATG